MESQGIMYFNKIKCNIKAGERVGSGYEKKARSNFYWKALKKSKCTRLFCSENLHFFLIKSAFLFGFAPVALNWFRRPCICTRKYLNLPFWHYYPERGLFSKLFIICCVGTWVKFVRSVRDVIVHFHSRHVDH